MAIARATMPIRVKSMPSVKLNPLLLVACMLLACGLLMMTSASVEIASSQYNDPFYYLKRQGIFALIGLLAMMLTLHMPVAIWKKFSWFLLMGSFVLLFLVLVPGIGKVVNGSARWIDLGFFNLQPSEVAKVSIVIYLSAYLERNLEEVRDKWSGFLKPMLVIGVAAVLLELEPDHGALVILMLTAFCMIFLAGIKLYRFLIMLGLCSGAVAYIALTKPYVIVRFSSYLNPWAEENVYGGGLSVNSGINCFWSRRVVRSRAWK